MTTEFDDIRPYHDSEAKDAYYRLMDDPRFQDAIIKCLPNYTVDDLRKDFVNYHSIDDVQVGFIKRWLDVFVSQTSAGITMSGLEDLDPNQAYLFISNHRDITFDPAMLQYYCFLTRRHTSKIAIGDNLLKTPVLNEVGRLNKMIKVKRSGTLREKLLNSKHLAAYIQYSLFEEKESIWIAQRDGRTKDGNDYTKQGLVKMVSLGHDKDLIETIRRMNITPMSISYEFEPCDQLKAREMALSENGVHYEKRPGEDFESIKQGIFGQKGRIFLTIGKPIHEELETMPENLNNNDKLYFVCQLIDKQIYANYKLYPNNYIAADLMHGTSQFSEFYTTEQKEKFELYLQKKSIIQDVSKEKMMDYLLHIYGNPVANKVKTYDSASVK
ncbi:MAG: 1-acyl-sn-glycerol-3-phosphate acyltransferase [Bacteroidales bacterium]|nr:1-acyl-sn-glycerol-3-phosphate acyltransferase [Bacteroidales bacterium]